MSALHDDCDEEEEDEDPYQHLYGHMLSSGSATPSQIAELKLQRRSKDTLTIVRKQLASTHYLTDPSVPSRTELVLSAAASLDSLHRREEAIFLLANNRFVEDDVYSDSDSDTPPPIAPDPSIQIALAKILFKQDRKVEALALTSSVMNGVSLSPSYAEPSDASDAFYLTGWIHIHNDNHTEAYKTWREGATALPESPELQRQLRKRECWDVVASTDTPLLPDLVPTAPVPTLASLKPFAVPAATPCPALSLYDPVSQNRNLVWRSTTPVLTPAECAAVLSYVQHHVTSVCGSNWPTVRKSSVKTTDVAVEDIPVLRPWLRALLKTRLFPLLNEAYPKLADGTSTLNAGEASERGKENYLGRESSLFSFVHTMFVTAHFPSFLCSPRICGAPFLFAHTVLSQTARRECAFTTRSSSGTTPRRTTASTCPSTVTRAP